MNTFPGITCKDTMVLNQPKTVRGPLESQNEERLRLLIQTGLLLASERSLDAVIQAALDAGLKLCGARYGIFFYNQASESGEPKLIYKLSGLSSSSPIFPRLDIFTAKFFEQGTVRSSNIELDARIPSNVPFAAMPPGYPPARSYLAVPVRTRDCEVYCGLIYGHPEDDVFDAGCEDLVATVASQAAVAMDNVRLSESLTCEIDRAETARRLQRQMGERLRQALDAAQLGTWSWDRASDLLDLDERSAHLLQVKPHVPFTRTELRERLVAPEDLQKTTESLRRAVESGGHYNAEYRVASPDGHQTWVSASGIPIFAPDSTQMEGMVGTVQDITARKTQESSLRESEKLAATGRLAATIAHEINNPLEAVTNLIYLSRTDPGVPAPVQRLLETADSELARVALIAQQTLGFYRDTTRPVEIDLNKLLQSVVDLFARKMASGKIACTLDLQPGLSIHGLQGEIRQVFSNLVVNAIDSFSSHAGACVSCSSWPGCIHIRGRHLSGSRSGVSILVSDRGSGIPAHVRDRIFSPFFTTKQTVGTGLGLWVTNGFVEKQGGSVRFRTRTGDRSGTIFRVFLPIRA